MTRQTLANPAAFTDEQKAEYESFTRNRKPLANGSLGGPFDPWLLNPELSRRLRGLGAMLWARPPRAPGPAEPALSIPGKAVERPALVAGLGSPRLIEARTGSAAALGLLAESLYANGRPVPADEPLYLRSPDVTLSAGPKRVTG